MRILAVLGLLAGCGREGGAWGGGGTPGDEQGPGNSSELGDDTGAETGETAETGGTPEGTGYQQGDVAYDLTGADQDGADWALYDHLEGGVVLVTGHMDYGTMVSTLGELTQVEAAFPAADLVALVGRDEYGIAADQEDALRWVEGYGLDTALVDPVYNTVNLWSEGTVKTYVIGPDASIGLVLYGAATAEQIAAGLQG